MAQFGKNVSDVQKHYLAAASSQGAGVGQVAEGLLAIARDQDITGGSEDVHPRWIRVFDSAKHSLQQALPKEQFEDLDRFFQNLSGTDPEISSVDPGASSIAFLLGAGASKPDPSKIPTVKELLPHLLERARRLDREDVGMLAKFCVERGITSIEDLLTAAHLATFCSRNATILSLVNFLLYRGEMEHSPRRFPRQGADVSSVAFLQDTLQVLFGLLSSMMLPAKPNPAHDAIAQYVKEHAGSVIVTTNYDCCMDLALGEVDKDFSYGLSFANIRNDKKAQQDTARLLKLHGSLNWFYCETCQEVQLVDIRGMIDDFMTDKAPYPVIGICKKCGGQRRGLLVAPLAMKFDVAPPLSQLVPQVSTAFEQANLIVVVGFSFADADLYISRLISRSMQRSATQRLIIVDPSSQVAEKMRRKLEASIPSFEPSRVLRIVGDCAEALPAFLTGALRGAATERKDSNGNGRKARAALRKV